MNLAVILTNMQTYVRLKLKPTNCGNVEAYEQDIVINFWILRNLAAKFLFNRVAVNNYSH